MGNTNRRKGKEKPSYPALKDFLTELGENCLLLARHGETDWNASKIIQGQQDRPLNQTGFEQRKNLFFMLNNVALTRIYSSTLQRTIQTALPLCIEKNIVLERKPELNEIKLGIFEGQHKEIFKDDYSKKCYQAFLNDEINVLLPGGGENLRMVEKRIKSLVKNCAEIVLESGHILMVGHRNVNKMIIKVLMDLDFQEGYEIEHKNSWLYVFVPKDSKIYLVEITAPGEIIQIQSGYGNISH
jgi:broad specificity phosphatase PhoE